ncbi:hypothetical protein RIF29_16854 [Crotalaria pallida]|uniref:Uncharacterized protein n=1 Tax=Crotalaria pallida TaxID=3830 RepID=A0AAN9FG08_CROPI
MGVGVGHSRQTSSWLVQQGNNCSAHCLPSLGNNVLVLKAHYSSKSSQQRKFLRHHCAVAANTGISAWLLWRQGIARQLMEQIDFFAIQESKCEQVDDRLCHSLWGTDNCGWSFNPSICRFESLINLWDSRKFTMQNTFSDISFSGVYLLSNDGQCLMLMIRITLSVWWGDFNDVLCREERVGLPVNSGMMKNLECNQFISSTNLIDIPLCSKKFTCVSPYGNALSRLDKILVSDESSDHLHEGE